MRNTSPVAPLEKRKDGPSERETAPRRSRPWKRLVAVGLVLALLVSAPLASDHVRAAIILSRAVGRNGWYTRFYDRPFTITSIRFAGRHGPIEARLYRPSNRSVASGLVLLHGVQYMGIDDDRLDRLATELARGGFVVLTPEIVPLSDYHLGPQAEEVVEDSIVYFATRSYVANGRVGVVGASFAGGIALDAAARPNVRPRVATVISVGGQYRVEDVIRSWLLPARDPVEQESRRYGLMVFAYAYADRFVATEHAPEFQSALLAFLHGDLARAEQQRQLLDPADRDFAGALFRGEGPVLAPTVLRVLPSLRDAMAALSPAGRLAGLRDTPVYVIHGRSDAVIPPSEGESIARELAPGGHVRLVVTDAIDHVHLGMGGVREQLRVIHALAGALDALQ